MSLQRYLFLLIAVFILLIAGVQFFLIEQVRAQVNQEISTKSSTISKVAIDGINERLHENLSRFRAKQRLLIKIEDTPNKQVQINPDLSMTTGDKTRTITVSREAALVPLGLVEFMQVSNQNNDNTAISVRGMQSNYQVESNFIDSKNNFQKIVSFDPKSSSVDQYFDRLVWLLLLVSLVGLTFAYWLASHISKPLSQLSRGFTFLEQGDFDSQIQPQGIKEIRDTLIKFNQTSKRLSQLQVLEKKFQQQQQMAELGELARGLAHTLRNPLNTIGLGISQLQQPNLAIEEQQQIAQHIQDKIQHLDNTIKTLLHLANNQVIRDKSVNLVPVVSDILLEISITKHAAIDFQQKSAVCLICSEAEIRAMFHALISNAIEANNKVLEGKSKRAIKLNLEQQEDGVLLTVEDEGSGISPQIVPDLFKPHISTKAEGAGMGLFIVKRISHLYYRGKIVLTNIEPKGCCAQLWLYNAMDTEIIDDREQAHHD
jgi:signal transduction histidine kinase